MAASAAFATTILEQQTEIAALGHDWDESVVTKEPTCTEDGTKLYTCQRCGETNTETIPATGHSYEESWNSDGENHWRVCQVLRRPREEAAHSWKWVVDQEPSGTQAGKQHQECTVCGARGEERDHPDGNRFPTLETARNTAYRWWTASPKKRWKIR